VCGKAVAIVRTRNSVAKGALVLRDNGSHLAGSRFDHFQGLQYEPLIRFGRPLAWARPSLRLLWDIGHRWSAPSKDIRQTSDLPGGGNRVIITRHLVQAIGRGNMLPRPVATKVQLQTALRVAVALDSPPHAEAGGSDDRPAGIARLRCIECGDRPCPFSLILVILVVDVSTHCFGGISCGEVIRRSPCHCRLSNIRSDCQLLGYSLGQIYR